MQRISLIKRLLYYGLLLVIDFVVLLLLAVFYGVYCESSYIHITIPILIYIVLPPQYTFGLIFLKTKWIFKLIVPFITSLVYLGIIWLIGIMIGAGKDPETGRAIGTGNFIGRANALK